MFWFRLTNAAAAPRVDLEFIKSIYSFHDQKYAQTAIRAMSNHLWYFTETTIVLSLFDNEVDLDEKRKMIEALKKQRTHAEGKQEIQFKPSRKPTQISSTSSLSDFVNEGSYDFFTILNVSYDFLAKDPEEWPAIHEYVCAKKRVDALQVVNDIAERAVKMTTDFNGKLTKDPNQEQFLLQVVEYHRTLKN